MFIILLGVGAAVVVSDLYTEEEQEDYSCEEFLADLNYYEASRAVRFESAVDYLVENFHQDRLQAELNIRICESLLTPIGPARVPMDALIMVESDDSRIQETPEPVVAREDTVG